MGRVLSTFARADSHLVYTGLVTETLTYRSKRASCKYTDNPWTAWLFGPWNWYMQDVCPQSRGRRKVLTRTGTASLMSTNTRSLTDSHTLLHTLRIDRVHARASRPTHRLRHFALVCDRHPHDGGPAVPLPRAARRRPALQQDSGGEPGTHGAPGYGGGFACPHCFGHDRSNIIRHHSFFCLILCCGTADTGCRISGTSRTSTTAT